MKRVHIRIPISAYDIEMLKAAYYENEEMPSWLFAAEDADIEVDITFYNQELEED